MTEQVASPSADGKNGRGERVLEPPSMCRSSSAPAVPTSRARAQTHTPTTHTAGGIFAGLLNTMNLSSPVPVEAEAEAEAGIEGTGVEEGLNLPLHRRHRHRHHLQSAPADPGEAPEPYATTTTTTYDALKVIGHGSFGCVFLAKVCAVCAVCPVCLT